jgi:succinate dehydrogenase / fumarate reductase, cytochrome b subunit
MARNTARPLSPHLFRSGIIPHYKWGAPMMVSIIHRACGFGLATAGAIGLVWWLLAASNGPESYDYFLSWANWWPGYVVGVGLTWAFFQHMCSGLRHFVLDSGAGYELGANRLWALATFAASITMTGLFWAYIYTQHGLGS